MSKNIFHLLFLIIAACSIQLSAQEILNNDYLRNDPEKLINPVLHKSLMPDDLKSEVIRETWDNTQWNEEQRTLFTYDSEGNVIEEKTEIKNGSDWINDTRILLEYENGNLTSHAHYQWNGTEWLNVWRNVTTFDEDGYSVSYSLETGDSLSWIYSWRYLYYRNQNTHLIDSTRYQGWSSGWVDVTFFTYFYTTDGRDSIITTYNSEGEPTNKRNYTYDNTTLSYVEIIESWSETGWENNRWNELTYDSNDNLIEELLKIWDDTEWENTNKSIHNYNEQNLITETRRQFWNGLGWNTDWRRTYEYTNGMILKIVYQDYDFGNWINISQSVNEYDTDNLLLTTTTQEWNGTEWVNNFRDRFLYGPSTSVEDKTLTTDFKLFNNYPNPFNPTTKISWQSSVGSWQTLKIYDVLGNLISTPVDEYKSAGRYEIEFNASGLASGIYFYQLQTKNLLETKKMILMK